MLKSMPDFNEIWQGRLDGGNPLHHRIFQRVVPGNEIAAGDFGLIGFAVDEGVRRNKGRVGAAAAPDVIRKNMANFPVVQAGFMLKDLGSITAKSGNLEGAQDLLASAVAQLHLHGAKSVVLGGGHEVMLPHFQGLRRAFPEKKIGVLNIDAHFDNRTPADGRSTSGTGFYEIARNEPIHSLHLGIQRNCNTLALFDTAHQLGMKYILAEEIFFENLPKIYPILDEFADSCDVLYITICMDVFNAAIAPGVSAVAYNGIFADVPFMMLYRHLLVKPNLCALNVAEVNPTYDLQDRTARLAAALVNEWFMV